MFMFTLHRLAVAVPLLLAAATLSSPTEGLTVLSNAASEVTPGSQEMLKVQTISPLPEKLTYASEKAYLDAKGRTERGGTSVLTPFQTAPTGPGISCSNCLVFISQLGGAQQGFYGNIPGSSKHQQHGQQKGEFLQLNATTASELQVLYNALVSSQDQQRQLEQQIRVMEQQPGSASVVQVLKNTADNVARARAAVEQALEPYMHAVRDAVQRMAAHQLEQEMRNAAEEARFSPIFVSGSPPFDIRGSAGISPPPLAGRPYAYSYGAHNGYIDSVGPVPLSSILAGAQTHKTQQELLQDGKKAQDSQEGPIWLHPMWQQPASAAISAPSPSSSSTDSYEALGYIPGGVDGSHNTNLSPGDPQTTPLPTSPATAATSEPHKINEMVW